MTSIAVFGGGVAGTSFVKELQKRAPGQFDITVVEPKEYFE
jgi:protoporphyrinogen oxidase